MSVEHPHAHAVHSYWDYARRFLEAVSVFMSGGRLDWHRYAPDDRTMLLLYRFHLFGMIYQGLIQVSEQAVLNANYMMARLKGEYELPFDTTCMHECVFSASRQLKQGVHAIDIAKYLIDRGYHPPTVYFPLIVKEAIMIEPTETESKQTMDAFIAVMKEAAEVAEKDPEALHQAPVLPVEMAGIHQVERVTQAVIQMQEKDRQAVVERISRCVNDARSGKQTFDQADQQDKAGRYDEHR